MVKISFVAKDSETLLWKLFRGFFSASFFYLNTTVCTFSPLIASASDNNRPERHFVAESERIHCFATGLLSSGRTYRVEVRHNPERCAEGEFAGDNTTLNTLVLLKIARIFQLPSFRS